MNGALKAIGWLTIALGLFSPTVLAAGDNSGTWLIVSISCIVSGIFILGFAKVIDLLTDIRSSLVDISGKEPQKVQSFFTKDLS